MNELASVALFFLIFGILLVLYGILLTSTGDAELLPYRAMYSVSGPEDVRRVGRIVAVIGLIIGGICAVVRFLSVG